ncbi:glycosyltransferase [Epibacterium sp. MM17-32]|uniref:O-linked N-acetylglucosamine transferase, SPINDLY family protein n=1 Tax=Epibacterium sp. MM17-32 TaxID=2917734 RepID=UPI001EF6DAC3|nr:glycosyltransferase [Epibacterium sp. MM17-32]
MSQPSQTSKLAVTLNGKPEFPEFEKFATSIKSQERAKFAYEMKNGLRNGIAPGDKPQDSAKKLLKRARAEILKHHNQRAETLLRQAISLDENNATLHAQLGEVLMKDMQRLVDALACFMRAVKLEPTNGGHYGLIGTLLMRMQRYDEAIDYFQIAVKFDPKNYIALSRMMHMKAHRLRWDEFEKLPNYLKAFNDKRVVSDPFAFLSLCDDGSFQRLRSEAHVRAKHRNPVKAWKPVAARPREQKIRIGYFSNDFYNHATMHLMAGLLERHDRERFEIFIYDYGSKRHDHEHQRARRNADQFYDVRAMDTTELVDLARADGIDIGVDLKGYTEGGRLDIFNDRVAPVQVAYLGYPGTTGLKSMDYMVADRITIPSHLRKHYSEHILYMPHCYQPNDENRYIATSYASRATYGLPAEGFVFSSFNNPYKVTPREFDIWMNLLKEVPDSVLWFYTSKNEASDVIRKEAESRGVDGARIITAGRLQPEEHLARLRFADLFLDTFNVNAHTTASDALWAGLPVVTKTGEQFAARVAGSVLTAAGLSDLVTSTEKKYHDVALRVAQDPDYHADIKARIAESHSGAPLFDTSGYTRDFEQLLEKAFQNYLDGNGPRHMGLSA